MTSRSPPASRSSRARRGRSDVSIRLSSSAVRSTEMTGGGSPAFLWATGGGRGEAGTVGRQHPPELLGCALDRDDRRGKPALHLAHGGQQVGSELEAELGGKANRAEHPQRIVRKGPQWVGWGAQGAGLA